MEISSLRPQEKRTDIEDSLTQIKRYLETEIVNLKKDLEAKNAEVKFCRDELDATRHTLEGTRQLVNKLLGDMSKLQNDIEWYKRTYEQRSFLGTIWEKIAKQRKV